MRLLGADGVVQDGKMGEAVVSEVEDDGNLKIGE
jgi:hypothetical protein